MTILPILFCVVMLVWLIFLVANQEDRSVASVCAFLAALFLGAKVFGLG